ncbi:keratin, type I cytoskeletal 18 [Cricetulus griseus]|nr:keratin, type I cytoskeletal 18 [Cricetulus griseus]
MLKRIIDRVDVVDTYYVQSLDSRKDLVRRYGKQLATIQAVQKLDTNDGPSEEPKALPMKWLTDEPVWVGQWPMTSEKLKALKRLVQEQPEAGHIEESTSPWNSPVFVIKKKSGNGTIRKCGLGGSVALLKEVCDCGSRLRIEPLKLTNTIAPSINFSRYAIERVAPWGLLAHLNGWHPDREGDHAGPEQLPGQLPGQGEGLETENRRLESKIREHLEKKGSQGVRDLGHYFKTIEDLRAQIFANSVDNASIVLQIHNAQLAADEFRVNPHGGTAIHEEESRGGRQRTGSPDCQLWTDRGSGCPQIRAQYEELAQKNCEELDKYWSQQSAEIRDTEITLKDLMRTFQALEIDLDAMKNQKISLENSLRDVEAGYSANMEQPKGSFCTWSQSWHKPRQRGNARPRNMKPC